MCCGSQRAAARAAVIAAAGRPAAVMPAAAPATSVIVFEYLGSGAATIRGPASGQLYRFAHAGDRIAVDARDRPGLAMLTALRWVR